MIDAPQRRVLPFKIEQTGEPLIARSGLVLPYEMAKALKLPQVIDRELPGPGRRRMGKDGRGLWGLCKVNRHEVAEVLRRDNRTEYTLDTDATLIEAEKAEAQWSYQKEKGYQPLLGFLFELGLALGDEFRDGNVPAGARAVEFLDFCVQMMPKGKRIRYYRSDSAAYQAGVINYCFGHDMLFTITADQDEAVKEAIKNIRAEEWQPYERDREIAETIHTMNKTKEAFRLIVQRWPKLQGELFNPDPYCYHVIATNRGEPAKEVVKLHNQRGQVENYIKELKNGFGMDCNYAHNSLRAAENRESGASDFSS